jgi:hypothetical protein
MPSTEIRLLLAQIDWAYDRQSWHGTNLRGSVRGVNATQASRRPRPGRHNIRELVVHAAYWKYAVWRRMTGGARGSFPLKGSNWFACGDEPDERAWRDEVALLDRMHEQLRSAVAVLPAKDLSKTPKGSKVNTLTILSGIIAHDLYHAGQIQLIKRLTS